MYTFLSFVGVIVTLIVLSTIPFIVDRNAPAVAHPHAKAEPEPKPERASLPASDSSAPEGTSRKQKTHEHPSHKSAQETTSASRPERSGETVSA